MGNGFLQKEVAKLTARFRQIMMTFKYIQKNDVRNAILADIKTIGCALLRRDMAKFDIKHIVLFSLFTSLSSDEEPKSSIIDLYYSYPAMAQASAMAFIESVAAECSAPGPDVLRVFRLLRRTYVKTDISVTDEIKHFYYNFAELMVKADGTVTSDEQADLDNIRKYIYGDEEVPAATSEEAEPEAETAEDLKEVMAEVNELIGMENIKQEIHTLTNFLKVQKMRVERGGVEVPLSLHMVFIGPPGTGKTTIARLISRIFKSLDVIKKGHLVETDRAGLVAGYMGQTSAKVEEIVKKSIGGVLFIDEAYTLARDDADGDYGREALEVLLKRMEDNRENLVVVLAGYSDEMKFFVEANPGLKSRFNRYFRFEHFKPEELAEIFKKFCSKSGFMITTQADFSMLRLFTALYEKKDRTFGNARLARNMFEKAIEKQANRIVNIVPITNEILNTITEEDIKEMEKQFI